MSEPARSESFSVKVAGETVLVNIGACVYKSEVLAQLQNPSNDKVNISRRFADFPGGVQLFRSIIAFLAAANNDMDNQETLEKALGNLSSPVFTTNSIAEYLQAAALLQSPILLLGIARSKICKEVSSGAAFILLEQIIAFMKKIDESALLDASVPMKSFSEPLESALVEVVCSLCMQLDESSFKLGPTLVSVSSRVSLQILKCYSSQVLAKSSDVSSASQAVSKEIEENYWNEHRFALHTLKQHLQQSFAEQDPDKTGKPPSLPPFSLLGAAPEPDDYLQSSSSMSSCDITEEICDGILDSALVGVADFAEYLEQSTAPPMLAAVMVRSLLSSQLQDSAKELFQSTFANNHKIQDMVVTRQIPGKFLRYVSKDRSAAVALRRMLATYESMDHAEICDLCEGVLFAELLEEEHASHIIFKHELMRPLLLWMRSGGISGGAMTGAKAFDSSQLHGESGASSTRLRNVGARLFTLCFTDHDGFLPTDLFPDSPWDSGGFDMPLLEHVSLGEDSLQMARRVLLRHLWRGGAHTETGNHTVQSISRIWMLGRWTRCLDQRLIAEAFAFLSACWRAVAGIGCSDEPTEQESVDSVFLFSGAALVGSSDRRTAEEILFKMFSDLDVWRLPPKDLLTPWVPGQLLVCHVTAQCRKLEECQVTLAEEAHANLQEIAELRATIAQLTARLETTDTRSQACMQKQADLNETMRQLK